MALMKVNLRDNAVSQPVDTGRVALEINQKYFSD